MAISNAVGEEGEDYQEHHTRLYKTRQLLSARLLPIRVEIGVKAKDLTTYHPNRNRHPLLRDSRIAHATKNSGNEVGNSSRAILKNEDEDEKVQADIAYSSQHTLGSRELPSWGAGFCSVVHHASNSEPSLFLAESLARSLRVVG